MQREVSCRIELSAAGPAEVVFSVAVASMLPVTSEAATLNVAGRPVAAEVLTDVHGGRLHRVCVDGGLLQFDYRAVIEGLAAPAVVDPVDRLRYRRQSRYCEADRLAPTASAEFAGLTGQDLLGAVVAWVRARIAYVGGSSTGTDSAVNTLLARRGVCRDFAHLAIALLRALGVPARLAAVYAPGLSPMEFHTVAEALIDDVWWVVDATALAPRHSLVRISTGRDAADTAFVSSCGAPVELVHLAVTAVASDFVLDDSESAIQLR